MIRNLKVLGLALVAMLTMGIAASSAMAAEDFFYSASAPVNFAGSQEGQNTFVTDSGTIHCTTATFSGSSAVTKTAEVKGSPTYSGCRSTGFIEANVTVDVNGCKYLVTAKTTTPNTIHIVECEAGKPGIVVTAPFCTITVTPQTIGQIHFFNENEGTTTESIILESTAEEIAYHESGFACKNSGSSTTGGKYTGRITITGENPVSHAHVAIHIGP